MTIRPLAEVRARLEEALSLLPGEPADPHEELERLEMVAIQIPDSEHTAFTPGLLEEYLQTYLYLRQLDLGLTSNFNE